MVVEIREWCQNVGEYNTYKFCIWHFGLCVIVSKIDRCRSSDPPYEIAINPIFRSYRVSDVIIQSFLNRLRWNLVHTLVARRARSAISDCLVAYGFGNYLSWIGNSLLKPIHKQITPQNITCRPESNIRSICLNPTDIGAITKIIASHKPKKCVTDDEITRILLT